MGLRFATEVVAVLFACTPAICQPGIAHLLYASPVHVSGVVLDTSANPIRDAQIDYVAVRLKSNVIESSAHAEADGRFAFDTLAPAVVVRAPGYVSQLLRVAGSATGEVRVVMQPAPVKKLVPSCAEAGKYVSAGGLFWLPKAAGVSVGTLGGSIDVQEREFTAGGLGKRLVMIHGVGPSWGGSGPRSRDVWSSAEYSDRTLRAGQSDVLDSRGTMQDGKTWRHIGVNGESAFYSDADPQAAAKFDRVLDGICIGRR